MTKLRAFSVLAFALFVGVTAIAFTQSPVMGYVAATAVAVAYSPWARRQVLAASLPAYADGAFPYGSQIVTLNGVNYIAEQLDFIEGTKVTERHDEKGNVNGALYQNERITGSMTLQLAATNTAIPARFQIVTLTFRGLPKQFIISKVSQPQKFDDIRKINVEIAEKIN